MSTYVHFHHLDLDYNVHIESIVLPRVTVFI